MSSTAGLQAKPIIGVIGGSGLYKLQGLKVVQQIEVKTPWGSPSSPITISETPSGVPIAFLARHGFTHHITPSGVPNLANIAALKSIGVRFIVAFTAVGSLKEEVRPRDFVVPDQLFDRTKGIRRSSFFGYDGEAGVVAHAGMGQPYDQEVRKVVEETIRSVLSRNYPDVQVHGNKTLVVMEGPQFSTRAESLAYRQLGGDIINMSALPEAKLAREAEIGYVTVATSTDYDSWREHHGPVDVSEVLKVLKQNVDASNEVSLRLFDVLQPLLLAREGKPGGISGLEGSMKMAIMTQPQNVPEKVKANINFVLDWYGKE
ncbi:purine phosphorylase [Jaminaea rosea]|uniref:S-methyl-5'-thioadenosine phosphorylase n=1 Tax=Jaminaea rosea TaxID=1569628 RepID=A0A316V2A0_9BASI|nr:purine phosphorylase [Jaminaea rosea]PWN30691.1 purine phosphorylase [Jaminaea rosea]